MIKQILKNKFIVISFSLITTLFLVLAFVQWSLIIGWLLGILVGLLNLAIGYFQVNRVIKSTKSGAILLTLFKFIFIIILNGGIIVAIIFINKAARHLPLSQNSNESVYGPINLFTYIGAITYTKFSTLTLYLMKGD